MFAATLSLEPVPTEAVEDAENLLVTTVTTSRHRAFLARPMVQKGLVSLSVGVALLVVAAWVSGVSPQRIHVLATSRFEQKQVLENESPETHELLKLLRVCQACTEATRFGEESDGGYVMCKNDINGSKLEAAYSLGIGTRDGWSDEIVAKYGIPSYQMDCTVDYESTTCDNCHFYKKCVEAVNGEFNFFDASQTWTMAQMLETTGHKDAPEGSLIGKFDIEGSEWPIFLSEPSANLLKFQQIVVEMHHINNLGKHGYYANVMKRMHHMGWSVAHLHGNNACSFMKLGEALIPKTLEVTLVRTRGPQECLADAPRTESDHRNIPSYHHLPTPHFV